MDTRHRGLVVVHSRSTPHVGNVLELIPMWRKPNSVCYNSVTTHWILCCYQLSLVQSTLDGYTAVYAPCSGNLLVSLTTTKDLKFIAVPTTSLAVNVQLAFPHRHQLPFKRRRSCLLCFAQNHQTLPVLECLP